ncbi:hypothetical protein BFP76_07350 [Amylibacter kogurei]|uniref:Phage tail assembly chaperone n=1 Tax=Paramylibacter kogurei TaxID=1889778 RepID=A0A2G5K606_9RHOB|nr:rcc01693 family protein [Amylibacter kogurei]PIB24961.1 hypothetical protein BFP76_07350 [Amylibacter kogurei]
MNEQRGLDWAALMALGLHQLRLNPTEFWALTPYELTIIAGVSRGDTRVLGRTGLNALMAQFPDS